MPPLTIVPAALSFKVTKLVILVIVLYQLIHARVHPLWSNWCHAATSAGVRCGACHNLWIDSSISKNIKYCIFSILNNILIKDAQMGHLSLIRLIMPMRAAFLSPNLQTSLLALRDRIGCASYRGNPEVPKEHGWDWRWPDGQGRILLAINHHVDIQHTLPAIPISSIMRPIAASEASYCESETR